MGMKMVEAARLAVRVLDEREAIWRFIPPLRAIFDELGPLQPESRRTWPGWCLVPVYAIAESMFACPVDEVVASLSESGQLVASIGLYAWAQTKSIYAYDSALSEALAGQELDGEIPAEALTHLPDYCVFIAAPVTWLGHPMEGFWAWLDYAVLPEEGPVLYLLFLDTQGRTLRGSLMLRGTIEESMRRKMAALQAQRIATSPKTDPSEFAACLNLLLYLCSDEPDAHNPTGYGGERARNEHGEPKRAAIWEVGYRIGRAMREAGAPDGEAPEREDTTSPRPHIRRAHWHHFWRGPEDGERELILKWLPPIPVNVDWKRELPAVVRLIK